MPELRPSLRPLLVAIDIVAVVVPAFLVDRSVAPVAVAVAAAATVWVCGTRDLHRSRLAFSVLEEIPTYLFAAVVAAVTIVATWSLTGQQPQWRFALVFAGVSAAFFLVLRICVYATMHALRRRRRIAHPVIIVGADEVGLRLATALSRHPEYGLKPVGMIESNPELSARDLPIPMLGQIQDLPLALTDLTVQDVIFAYPEPPDTDTAVAVRDCLQRDCQVFVVPRFFELMGLNHHGRVELVRGVPLLRLKRWPLQPHRVLAKRLLDVVVAVVLLLVLSPLMALCAVAVRLESGPGVLYRQTRVGIGGRTFTLLKFRSMRPATALEGATQWSIDDDPRVGAVGRFLRRSSLDELPQLINVLRGEMSLVGPRPERPHFVDEFSSNDDRYLERHRMPTGLTGWAQVNNLRGDTPIDDRVRFDNYYIENWTLWGDVRIMIRTLLTVVRRQPASRRGIPLVVQHDGTSAADESVPSQYPHR